MGVEEDEEIDGTIAAILKVITLKLAGRGRDRFADLPD
jgi:hypothetical protein